MAKAQETRSQGRPSKFTDKLAAEIISRLSKGETLASICRDDKMPAVRTVSDWKRANPDFSADFLRARDEGFDAIAESCMAIGDDVEAEAAAVSKAKLRIDTRLKLLAKWDPRRYGDKLALTGGNEDDAPINMIQIVGVRPNGNGSGSAT